MQSLADASPGRRHSRPEGLLVPRQFVVGLDGAFEVRARIPGPAAPWFCPGTRPGGLLWSVRLCPAGVRRRHSGAVDADGPTPSRGRSRLAVRSRSAQARSPLRAFGRLWGRRVGLTDCRGAVEAHLLAGARPGPDTGTPALPPLGSGPGPGPNRMEGCGAPAGRVSYPVDGRARMEGNAPPSTWHWHSIRHVLKVAL